MQLQAGAVSLKNTRKYHSEQWLQVAYTPVKIHTEQAG